MSRTILLTGAAGLLGNAILRQLASDHSVIATCHKDPIEVPAGRLESVHIDLTVKEELRLLLASHEIDLVINCAGAVDVERCEVDHAYALSGNVTIVDNLIACHAENPFQLFQISTDYVFGGDCGPCRENDTPSPVNFYGESKLRAEKAILDAGISATTLRVCALYSLDPNAKPNLYGKTAQRLLQGQPVRAATDLRTTPTEINDLAAVVGELVDMHGLPRVLHLAAPEFLSRFDFAVQIAQHLGVNASSVVAVYSQDLNLEARRPARAGLSSNVADRLLQHRLHSFLEFAS
jgi:dTDP-4-dehydrorhamnose reductase